MRLQPEAITQNWCTSLGGWTWDSQPDRGGKGHWPVGIGRSLTHAAGAAGTGSHRGPEGRSRAGSKYTTRLKRQLQWSCETHREQEGQAVKILPKQSKDIGTPRYQPFGDSSILIKVLKWKGPPGEASMQIRAPNLQGYMASADDTTQELGFDWGMTEVSSTGTTDPM